MKGTGKGGKEGEEVRKKGKRGYLEEKRKRRGRKEDRERTGNGKWIKKGGKRGRRRR